MWTLRERIFIHAQYHGEVCGEGSGGISLVQGEAMRVFVYKGEARIRIF